MRKYAIIVITIIVVLFLSLAVVLASPPRGQTVKAKFYDFSEQVIDGEIKKPSNVYIDARQKAKFERLLSLKKSFLPKLFLTSKQKVFK